MGRPHKIPMSSISALTLHGDRMTTSRRVSPVPQLKCVGRACRSYQPPTVQCVPIGSAGGNDVQWKCEADLPQGYRFGSVEVGCEGWDDSSDPYILRGSCGLTYNLVKTATFEESSYRALPTPTTNNISWPALALGALALYLLFQAFRPRFPARFPSWNDARRWGSSWGGGPGGGGPGFGGGGPPPPYSSKPPGAGAAWQPGFWTGLAAGAAALQGANYLRGDGRQQRRQGWGLRDDDDDHGVGGSGSWGRPATGNGGGGAMRPSSGFGGTRNR